MPERTDSIGTDDDPNVEIVSASDLVAMQKLVREQLGAGVELNAALPQLMAAAQRAKADNPDASIMDVVCEALSHLTGREVNADAHTDLLNAFNQTGKATPVELLAKFKSQMKGLVNQKGRMRNPLAGPTIRNSARVGRNDPCPCGCGKKYKQCGGRKS